jgi:hypothetical protein
MANKKAIKYALIEMGVSRKGRAAVYEFIYRQNKKLPWDPSKAAYGVGYYHFNDLLRKGIISR